MKVVSIFFSHSAKKKEEKKEVYFAEYQTVPLRNWVQGVRETIKAQYLSEYLCGQTSKLSLEEQFSLPFRHHAACFP